MVRQQDGRDRGSDYSKVSGSEQESSQASVRFAGEPVLLGSQDPLAQVQRAGREEGDARETV